ncbi:MAG: DedA family protein [archaeon]
MVIDILVPLFTNIITTLGYGGVFVLMTLESMIFPVPSELVMPFAGYAVALGDMQALPVLLVATLGTLCGSGISYWVGFRLGRPFLEKHGKYFLINKHHLDLTERWFKKRGEITIFVSRLIPVVRHLISIPAGMAGMNKKNFFLYTLVGGTVWNAFLLYMGFLLGTHWTRIAAYTKVIDIVMLALVVLGLLYFLLRYRRSRIIRNKSSGESTT